MISNTLNVFCRRKLDSQQFPPEKKQPLFDFETLSENLEQFLCQGTLAFSRRSLVMPTCSLKSSSVARDVTLVQINTELNLFHQEMDPTVKRQTLYTCRSTTITCSTLFGSWHLQFYDPCQACLRISLINSFQFEKKNVSLQNKE